ncbi:hypothetical protein [Pseudomonas glycinae]|uniref:hypothetical protein n=1 Tax=Pseudomonas glycinae TaxID=1785145 RepID=UPI001CBA643A|nr:hypothetical protein [Pseudomonas glycinae]
MTMEHPGYPLAHADVRHARREAVLARAHELRKSIIEVDYDSEFRYEGSPTDLR